MYKAIIIEDEHKLREALLLMLKSTVPDKVAVAGAAESVAEAAQLIDDLRPDIVFMDIQLKDGTGFEVLERAAFKNFHLIFTTAYSEHALRAFKYSAVDYLLKPLDPEELSAAVNKIGEMKERFTDSEQTALLQQSLNKAPERVSLPVQEGIHIVALADIVRCETSGSYTTFHISDGRKIMVSKPLKHYDELLLPPVFFRIHQSHTINMSFAESYSRDGIVRLKDKTELPVAQRKKDEFLRLIRK